MYTDPYIWSALYANGPYVHLWPVGLKTLSPSADSMGAKTGPNPPAPIEVNAPPVTIFSEFTLLSLN